MTRVAPGAAPAGVHGLTAALTSFVGRADELAEVAGLLEEYRLVTVTGPGGVGKTRLAAEVARREADRFADGVWLAELAGVGEPTLVQAAVATALGLHQAPGVSLMDSLVMVLARQQLLLVLDNCEHVLVAVAELCGRLLGAADDVRILATSRKPIGSAGETNYRLSPLGLPRPDQSGFTGSEAVALFADRARQADPHFTLDGESGPVVGRLVQRLDGMPLAIELAAARVEALGAAQLLERLDERFELVARSDGLAAARHGSLTSTADWSYRLLGEQERRAFRRLSIIPGPFTLEAAEAVAGAGAGLAVLHLVGCSLLTPPRPGPDGRARYLMLETLRGYGMERLAEAGERPGTAAALAGHALRVAEQAAADLETSAGELPAARWLDAEDATMHQGLGWALEHDPDTALRLAVALAPWWILRGRLMSGYALLSAAAGHTATGGEAWCAAQLWLGNLAALATSPDEAGLGHFTAVRDALAGGGPSQMLVQAMNGRARRLLNLGRIPEAAEDARRALAMARELRYPPGEVIALQRLAGAAHYTGDDQGSLAWLRQAQRIDPAGIPASAARRCRILMANGLIEAGEIAAAQQTCDQALAWARQAGALGDQADCLMLMADLDLRAGRVPEARSHLREALGLAMRAGIGLLLIDCLDLGGHLSARAQRWGEAITLWVAHAAWLDDTGVPDLPQDVVRRLEPIRQARQALGPGRARAAEERGAAMTLATAAEFALLLVAADSRESPTAPGLARLTARERELVTLVARGRTDAQIADQLFISVRTVRSHLDRIRDKTGCRRRADLTRLALQAGLV